MKDYTIYGFFNDIELRLLKEYLDYDEVPAYDSSLNIVFDLLHSCGLRCIGCGTNAKHIRYYDGLRIEEGFSLSQLEIICIKIREYLDKTNRKAYINLGGGEPFLKKDIVDVIKLFYEYFGRESLGIDTSGILSNSYEELSNIIQYVSYIGISLNGLKAYHNWWSGIADFSAYDRTFDTIKRLCSDEENAKVIEVTSVATKKNMCELPDLMRLLSDSGVKKYSVHRSVPVGRMMNHTDLIPSALDYLSLLLNLVQESKLLEIDFHFHHSIENIHRALLLGKNTFSETIYGDPNSTSSIGICYDGSIVFNPWCMTGCWKKLSCGNIFDEGTLEEKLNNPSSAFSTAKVASSPENRCLGCEVHCSGGNRIVAAASALNAFHKIQPDVEDILTCFSAIDPACPLYEGGGGEMDCP